MAYFFLPHPAISIFGIISLILAFAVVFEMPLVLIFLAKIGVVSHKTLAASRKYAFLIILVVAAILTPADIVSMGIMAAPLYILFEISLFITRFVRSNRDVEYPASSEDETQGGDEQSAGSTPE